jgi:hypothetical protein
MPSQNHFKNKGALHLGVVQSAFSPLLDSLAGGTTLENRVITFHPHLAASLAATSNDQGSAAAKGPVGPAFCQTFCAT